MAELPGDLRRFIGQRREEAGELVGDLFEQVDLTYGEEDFARRPRGTSV